MTAMEQARSTVQRIILVRHGETEGESSIRFHGRGDVPLSALGRAQLEATSYALFRRYGSEPGQLVVASPLQRSWRGAEIVGRGRPVRIIQGFREVDFGRWEGLTAEEIRARDPELHEVWQRSEPGFAYPQGERVADFDARVARATSELLALRAGTVLAVLHKGVIRRIVKRLLGHDPLERSRPELAEALVLSRGARFELLGTD